MEATVLKHCRAHGSRVVTALWQATGGVFLMAEPERWQVSTDAAEVYESCFVPAIFGGVRGAFRRDCHADGRAHRDHKQRLILAWDP
jgi:hypothetical protein